MAQVISCSNKNDYTIADLLRMALVKNFQGAEAAEAGTFNALNLIHIEDSGEDYFCANKSVTDEILMRKLWAVDANDLPALRVSFGSSSTTAADCAGKHEQLSTLTRSIIGKGVDGEPLIRLTCANLPAIS